MVGATSLQEDGHACPLLEAINDLYLGIERYQIRLNEVISET